MGAHKLKVSLSIAEDVLVRVDRAAARGRNTRSGVVEDWLRFAADRSEAEEIKAATIAYYQGLPAAERSDEAALARALTRATRAVERDYKASPPLRSRRARD